MDRKRFNMMRNQTLGMGHRKEPMISHHRDRTFIKSTHTMKPNQEMHIMPVEEPIKKTGMGLGMGHLDGMGMDEEDDEYKLSNSDLLKLNLLEQKVLSTKATKGSKKKKIVGKGLTLNGNGFMPHVKVKSAFKKHIPELFNHFDLPYDKNIVKDIHKAIEGHTEMKTMIPHISKMISGSLLHAYHSKHGRKFEGSNFLRSHHNKFSKIVMKDVRALMKIYHRAKNKQQLVGSGLFSKVWGGIKKAGKWGFKTVKKNFKPGAKLFGKTVLKYGLPLIATALGQPELAPVAGMVGNIASKGIDQL